MCELLHTVSANQTCNSTILLLGHAPLALNAQRPPITGVPRAQIGGPLSGGTRLRSQGWVMRRPASIQNNSGLLRKIQVRPKDLPIRSVAGECATETLRLLGGHSWSEGHGPT